ncbi:hypothetical protein FJ364_05830 [Candidatus Dependentiae bacterium]|nr:hypothetical protein [Candidatus Dependentiae bacterium]
MVGNIYNAISFASYNQHPVKIALQSVLKLSTKSDKYDLIITDPPYLNDVQYGELSEFFYVWISRILQKYYPELPKRVVLDEDICQSKLRFENNQLAYAFFESGIKKAFVSMNKILKDDGLLVVFFAHSSTEAWNLLLECIRESRFCVVSSYAIHTEMTSNMISRGKTSFMSSIVVVCRKITKESRVYFEDLIPVVEDRIKDMLAKISTENLLILPITDLLIMVYGKVLEATTQYTNLLSYRKEFKPDFESLILNSRDFIMKEIVVKLTGRSLNLVGSTMSFYLLTKIFHRGILSSDDAIKVSRTYGLDIEKLESINLATKEKGIIRLYFLHENEINKKPEEIDIKNLHEQLCFLSYIANTKSVSKLTSILSNEGKNFKIDDLKQIISLLLKSIRLRINKGEQLDHSEQKELKILETLADTMGIKSEGSLDSFMK